MSSFQLTFILLTSLGIQAHATQVKAQNADLCQNLSIISHRGLAGLLPEESQLGYQAAADLGTDYLEMDVHRTKDSVLIVNHDNTFARTTDISKVYPNRMNDPIYTFTFDEILKLKNNGVPILKLEDVINISLTHPHHPGLYIESKSPELYPGVEKQIIDLLEAKAAFRQVKVYFQSFDILSIKKFKDLRPEIPRIYLSESPYSNLIKKELPLAIQFANGIGPDLNQVGTVKLSEFLGFLHKPKLVVHFWTVDAPELMKKLIASNVDGIFTNRTDLLMEACGKLNASQINSILANYPIQH